MHILGSRTQLRVALMALFVAAYSLLAMWKERSVYQDFGDIPAELHSALSLVFFLNLPNITID